MRIDGKGSCSSFQGPPKKQKFGCWALKKLKIVQKICPLVIFNCFSQNYDAFTSSSSHFQKNSSTLKACNTIPIPKLELGVALVSPHQKNKGVKMFLFYFGSQKIVFRLHIMQFETRLSFQKYII